MWFSPQRYLESTRTIVPDGPLLVYGVNAGYFRYTLKALKRRVHYDIQSYVHQNRAEIQRLLTVGNEARSPRRPIVLDSKRYRI